MSTLKEAIEKKFEFDNVSWGKQYALIKYSDIDGKKYSKMEIHAWGARWQHDQLKSEVLPILLECVEALDSIAAEKCSPSFDEVLQNLERGKLISIIDTDTAIAREALERLRKWSEGNEN